MDIAELLATDLDVEPIDDPRVRFYLDNQQLIETWARLRRDAAAALVERVRSLLPSLLADVEQLGLTTVIAQVEGADTGTPRLQLVDRRWLDADGLSPISIVLEWNGSFINQTGAVELYAGLRVRLGNERAEALVDQFAEIGARARSSLGGEWAGKRGRYPVWRWIRSDSESLDEVALIRLARSEIWRCWDASASMIDALLVPDGSVSVVE